MEQLSSNHVITLADGSESNIDLSVLEIVKEHNGYSLVSINYEALDLILGFAPKMKYITRKSKDGKNFRTFIFGPYKVMTFYKTEDDNNKKRRKERSLVLMKSTDAKALLVNPDNNGFKPDWEKFREILIRNNIKELYHVTDRSNIDSIIREGGLYSWSRCESKNIYISCPGGNELSRSIDSKKNLCDFVRLSLNPEQPMIYVAKKEGRIKDPIILKIDPSVIFFISTIFSNINATDSEAKIGGRVSDFKNIRFDILKNGWTNDLEKKFFQAEILVKKHIPIKFIMNLNQNG